MDLEIAETELLLLILKAGVKAGNPSLTLGGHTCLRTHADG